MDQGEVKEQGEKSTLYRLCIAAEMGKIVADTSDAKILLHHLLC